AFAPEPEPELDVVAVADVRCVVGRVVATVRVTNNDDVPVDVVVDSPYGTRSSTDVGAGGSVLHAFSTRAASIPDGVSTVRASALVDGEEVTTAIELDHAAASCG